MLSPAIARVGVQGAPLPLRAGLTVTFGGGEFCDFRVPGAPEIVAEVGVRVPGAHDDSAGLMPARGFDVVLTPFWLNGEGECKRDDESAALLQAGNTFDVGSESFLLFDADQSDGKSRPEGKSGSRITNAVLRLLIVAFPWLVPAARRKSVAESRTLERRAERRRERTARMGLTVGEKEADEARSLLRLGRNVGWMLLPPVLILLILISAVQPHDAAARMWVASALVASALLTTALTSTFFCASLGTWMLGGASVVAGAMAYSEDEIHLAISMAVAGFMLGFALVLEWSPIPNRKRREMSSLFVVAVAILLVLSGVWGVGSLSGLAIFSGLFILAWSGVVMPLVHSSEKRKARSDSGSLEWVRQRLQRGITFDAAALMELVMRRNRAQAVTRTVACVVAVVPVLIFLNSFSVQLTQSTLPAGAERIVWTATGEDVTPALLTEKFFYVVPDSLFEGIPTGRAEGVFGFSFEADSTTSSTISPFRVTDIAELRGLPDSNRRVFLSAGVIGRRGEFREHVFSSNFWDLSTREPSVTRSAAMVVAPMLLLMTFFGLLVLWRVHSRGALPILVAFWAVGTGLLPYVVEASMEEWFMIPIGLHPLVHSLLSAAPMSTPAALAYTALYCAGAVGYLASMGVLTGILPGLLLAGWLWPRGQQESVVARRSRRVATMAILAATSLHVWATLISSVAAGLLFMATPAIYAAVYAVVRRLGPRSRRGDWSFLVLLSAPPLLMIPFFLSDSGRFELAWLVSAAISILLLLVLGRIVLSVNLWNLSGGRTASTLGAALALPVLFGAVEQLATGSLVETKILPAAATGMSTVLLFGLLLRPVFRRLEQYLRALSLRRLRPVVRSLPRLIDGLVMCDSDEERTAQIRAVLESPPINLGSYALYSRWGSRTGRFKVMVDKFHGPPLADIVVSSSLLDDLATERTFIDVDHSFDEERFTFTFPELWRLQRQMGSLSSAREPGDGLSRWRCRYILPLSVGNSVWGLLIISSGQLSDSARSDMFASHLGDLGVAAV